MKPQKSEQQFKTKPAAAIAQNAASTSGKMTVQGMCGGCALNAGEKQNDCCGLCQHVKRAEPDAMHKKPGAWRVSSSRTVTGIQGGCARNSRRHRIEGSGKHG